MNIVSLEGIMAFLKSYEGILEGLERTRQVGLSNSKDCSADSMHYPSVLCQKANN